MSVTLLVVNYHSARLARAAIESARAATNESLEVVVVDNSVSPEEATALRQIDIDHLIISETNLGYGAGVNRSLGGCSGETIIVSNPDVVFASSSIDRLLEPMESERVALTGPAFYWDREMQWHLPPPEAMTFREQLGRNLARRLRWLAPGRRGRLLDRRLEVWREVSPRPVKVLSGAVMAFRAADLRRFRFDERYPLYFEEVDLMRRLGAAGRDIVYAPQSRVHHLWAHSSSQNPDSASLFDLSRRRYQQRWFGRLGDAVLQATSSRSEARCVAEELTEPYLELSENGEFLVELADDRDFVMAAGRFTSGGRVDIPLETLRRSPLDRFCCRVVDLTNLETLKSWTIKT
jgi:GT2 family glycosyltransferase